VDLHCQSEYVLYISKLLGLWWPPQWRNCFKATSLTQCETNCSKHDSTFAFTTFLCDQRQNAPVAVLGQNINDKLHNFPRIQLQTFVSQSMKIPCHKEPNDSSNLMFFFNVHWSVHRNNILVHKSQQDAHVTEFIWQSLYMFRASLSPIFRSTKQL